MCWGAWCWGAGCAECAGQEISEGLDALAMYSYVYEGLVPLSWIRLLKMYGEYV